MWVVHSEKCAQRWSLLQTLGRPYYMKAFDAVQEGERRLPEESTYQPSHKHHLRVDHIGYTTKVYSTGLPDFPKHVSIHALGAFSENLSVTLLTTVISYQNINTLNFCLYFITKLQFIQVELFSFAFSQFVVNFGSVPPHRPNY